MNHFILLFSLIFITHATFGQSEIPQLVEEGIQYHDNGELFIENTTTIFKTVGEFQEDKNNKKGIWWTLYAPFFNDLANSEHIETYCKYIRQGVSEDSENWQVTHQDGVEALET